MKTRLAPILLLIVVSALLGSQPIAMKILLEQIPPLTIALLRFIIAGLIMLPFLIKNLSEIRFGILLLPMLIFNSMNTILFLLGLSRTTPNATQILYAATPIIVALVSALILREKISKNRLAGLFLGLVGVISVVLLPLFQTGQSLALGSLPGNLTVFVAVLCWSGYTLLSQLVGRRYGVSPMKIMMLSLYSNIIFVLPFAFYFEKPLSVLSALNLKNMALLLYIGIATTIIAYTLYQQVIRKWSATTAALTTYIQPPIGYLIAFLVLGTPLSKQLIFGTAITLFGVLLVSAHKAPSPLLEKQDSMKGSETD